MKDGKKTSEFILAVAAHLFGAVLIITGAALGPDHWVVMAIGGIVNVLAQFGYTWSRTAVKTATAKAAALAVTSGAKPPDPS
jgi:hypothetical protein